PVDHVLRPLTNQCDPSSLATAVVAGNPPRDGLPNSGSLAKELNKPPLAAVWHRWANHASSQERTSRSWPKIWSCMPATSAVAALPWANSSWAATQSYKDKPKPPYSRGTLSPK